MRIIGGRLKGLRLNPPAKLPVRPTTDLAKEALFNIIYNQFDFDEIRVLDLFSGTGNISLEFASRESGHITSVDQNFNCVKFIKSLVKEVELEHIIDVYRADVRDFLKKTEKTFDLIFADPPYESPIHEQLVTTIFERKLLNEDGVVIIEHGRRTDLSHLPEYDQTKQYGNVYFSFLSYQEAAETTDPS